MCFWADPPCAVAVRQNFGNVREFQRALDKVVRTPYIQSFIFNSSNNPRGFLFQTNVQRFVPVETDTQSYLGAAGRAIQGLTSLISNSTGLPVRAASAPGASTG